MRKSAFYYVEGSGISHKDLNNWLVPIAPGDEGIGDKIDVRRGDVETPEIDAIFEGIKERLLKEIEKSEVVLGCVAWLTDFDILEALSKCTQVGIVVQKEDFLRPDLGATSDWKDDLRKAYYKLPLGDRHLFPGVINSLSTGKEPTMSAVRCVGNLNSEKSPAFPRMHNKFVLFGEILELEGGVGYSYYFDRLWTGSFNFTKNASYSFENALLVRSSKIIDGYFKEFEYIYALSEDLDWETPWMAPEWRIGS